jgi:hypothetical protein
MSFSYTVLDELEDKFDIENFYAYKEVKEQLNDSTLEYAIEDGIEDIDFLYQWELSIRGKKNSLMFSSLNLFQFHFIFYALYKVVQEEQKAVEQAKLAQQYYIKNTLAYQWENVVYNAFCEIPEYAVIPDCVIPNNKKPDLVVNPTYPAVKYHPRGVKINYAEIIIDMKTSLYDTSKEKKYYQKYCDKLMIVYLKGENRIKDKNITYLSSDELINMISKEKTISEIKKLQEKMELDYFIKVFDSWIGKEGYDFYT